MDFTIRKARVEDAETLVRLRMDLQEEIGALADADRQASARANESYFRECVPSGQFTCWIAEAVGQIVGTSGLVFYRRPPSTANLSGIEAHIMNMYTVPAWRGHGVATELLARCLAEARARNAGCVRLHASSAGRLIYESAGFVAKDNEMVLHVPEPRW